MSKHRQFWKRCFVFIPVLMALILLQACQSNSGGVVENESVMEVEGAVLTEINPEFAQLLYADMHEPHEYQPSGVPEHYDWSNAPRLSFGNDPRTFQAFIAWGQVYVAEGTEPIPGIKIQIANLQSYVLDLADNQWYLLQGSEKVDGGRYREDFVGDISEAADIRDETPGISVSLRSGFNFHFWPKGGLRKAIVPDRIGGIITTVEARLVADSPEIAIENAVYLMSVGADYWSTKDAVWDRWLTNGDVGIGRFRRIDGNWQIYTMSSLPEEKLSTPLPVIQGANY